MHVESPFEFRALEVALEAICSFLAARTTELETAAYPALDELTSKVCTFSSFFISMFLHLVSLLLTRSAPLNKKGRHRICFVQVGKLPTCSL